MTGYDINGLCTGLQPIFWLVKVDTLAFEGLEDIEYLKRGYHMPPNKATPKLVCLLNIGNHHDKNLVKIEK